MEKDSKIYVAGHAGLVGSALIRRFESEGFSNLITRKYSESHSRMRSCWWVGYRNSCKTSSYYGCRSRFEGS